MTTALDRAEHDVERHSSRASRAQHFAGSTMPAAGIVDAAG